MNIYLKNVAVGLMAFLLCFPMIFHFAFADKSSTQLSSTYDIDSGEEAADSNIANLIASYSSVAGYDVHNWYGSLTNSSTILSAAAGANATYSIVFHIGEANKAYVINWWPFSELQWFIAADDVGTRLFDKEIFPYSSLQRVRFAFLWCCEQADTIGGHHWSQTSYGMPYAWLHNASISENGYTNPDSGGQTFLGFDGFAYWLTFPVIGIELQQFLNKFYFSALCYGATYSVNSALDYAARLTWNVASFEESWLYRGYNYTYFDPQLGHQVTLYGQVKVYGDGNMHLSNLHSAMKTGTDGFFYKPSAVTGPLKIELLFDDQYLAGDQTGGTIPYGTLASYPDGTVDMCDISFIIYRFGSSENQSNWDYMADIVPDRTIDMADLSLTISNWGSSGTYITSLANVTVLYSNGAEISPDSNGFVLIPPEVTSFTVKRYGIPIGAMMIF